MIKIQSLKMINNKMDKNKSKEHLNRAEVEEITVEVDNILMVEEILIDKDQINIINKIERHVGLHFIVLQISKSSLFLDGGQYDNSYNGAAATGGGGQRPYYDNTRGRSGYRGKINERKKCIVGIVCRWSWR